MVHSTGVLLSQQLLALLLVLLLLLLLPPSLLWRRRRRRRRKRSRGRRRLALCTITSSIGHSHLKLPMLPLPLSLRASLSTRIPPPAPPLPAVEAVAAVALAAAAALPHHSLFPCWPSLSLAGEWLEDYTGGQPPLPSLPVIIIYQPPRASYGLVTDSCVPSPPFPPDSIYHPLSPLPRRRQHWAIKRHQLNAQMKIPHLTTKMIAHSCRNFMFNAPPASHSLPICQRLRATRPPARPSIVERGFPHRSDPMDWPLIHHIKVLLVLYPTARA